MSRSKIRLSSLSAGSAILLMVVVVLAGCPLPYQFTPDSTDASVAANNDPANPSVTAAPNLVITETTSGTSVDATPSAISASRNVNIGFDSETPGATIFFTKDGSRPIPGAGSTNQYTPGSPVVMDSDLESLSIRAIAIAPSMYPSVTTERTVTVAYNTVATPVISPASGLYQTNQNVTITTATAGATIYYTIVDGTGGAPTPDPGAPGTLVYTGPIAIAGMGTEKSISAIAVKDQMRNSAVAAASYSINLEQAAAPTFTPNGAVTTTGVATVTISSTTPSATIWYTTDGSAPVAGGGGTTQQIPSGSSFTTVSSIVVRAVAISATTRASAESTASFVVTGFDAIGFSEIIALDGGMTTSSIDNSDGNLIPVGTIIYYVTGEGRYGKLLVKVVDPSNNYGLVIDYVTYNADSTVAFSGVDSSIRGTWLFDLDQNNSVQGPGTGADFQLVNQNSTVRSFAPIAPARFYLVP